MDIVSRLLLDLSKLSEDDLLELNRAHRRTIGGSAFGQELRSAGPVFRRDVRGI